MKHIAHILISSKYLDGMGYQENYLTKKHHQLGYDVSIISFSEENKEIERSVDENGILVVRLPFNNSLYRKLPFFRGFFHRVNGLLKELERLIPDIIFVHGIGIADDMAIVKYKHHHDDVVIYADSHADYYNTPLNTLVSKIEIYTYGRYFARQLTNVCKKVWGVSPWRVDYMNKVYKVSKDKTGLLVMGGDEDKVTEAIENNSRNTIRKKYGIPNDAFVIVSGGKMDAAKNIHLLAQAVHMLQNKQVYLILFGKMDDECQNLCMPYLSEQVIQVGWLDSDAVYPYFIASDLAVFPGTHSVLWEQSCSAGIPAIFKGWGGGFNHLDVGGNCIFVDNPTAESLYHIIVSLINNNTEYNNMVCIAKTKACKRFSYHEIAKQSIELI